MGKKAVGYDYPDSVKEAFLKTPNLVFRDGSHVTPAEILEFMTKEGPLRYPNLFSKGRDHGWSEDKTLISSIKRNYFRTTLFDRLNKAEGRGIPTVLIQGGQTHELYYAAGSIPIRPGSAYGWATNIKENMSFEEADMRRLEIRELGRQDLSIEACVTAGYEVIQKGYVPIKMVSPYLCLRCSDISFGVEAHRHGPVKLPLGIVDFPVPKAGNKAGARKYAAENLRRLAREIAKLTGIPLTDERLWEEIHLHNQKRALAREYIRSWWQADIPPTNSLDHTGILGLGNESSADPVASKQILEESREEVKARIAARVKAQGLVDNPVRLFVSGSCVSPNQKILNDIGGIVVGKDDGWSLAFNDVKEEGDPYDQLAATMLSYPYELPTIERAKWIASQVKESRAEGLIFMYQWGCNYQSGIARLVADVVKQEAGIPTIIIEKAMAEGQRGPEQQHARVEVFVEMLRSARGGNNSARDLDRILTAQPELVA